MNWLSKKLGYTYTIRSRCSGVLLYYVEAGKVVVRTRSQGEAAMQKIQKMVRGLKRKWNGELTWHLSMKGMVLSYSCSFCLKLGIFIADLVHPASMWICSCSMLKDVHYYCVCVCMAMFVSLVLIGGVEFSRVKLKVHITILKG